MRIILLTILSLLFTGCSCARKESEKTEHASTVDSRLTKGLPASRTSDKVLEFSDGIFKEKNLGNLPADPGEEGKKDLKGVDADHDLLRDDVQIYIARKFPSDSPKRQALRQASIYLTRSIEFYADKKNVKKFSDGYLESVICLRALYPKDKKDQALDDLIELKKSIFNTWDRLQAYLATQEELSGTTFEVSALDNGLSHCKFDAKGTNP